MSDAFATLRAIRDLRGLSSVDKSVLYSLALRADQNGETFPKYETIAGDAGITSRCAMTTVKRLAGEGYLTVISRMREGTRLPTSNLYRITVGPAVQVKVNDVHHAVIDVHPQGEPASPLKVNDVHVQGEPRSQDLPIDLPNGTTQTTTQERGAR